MNIPTSMINKIKEAFYDKTITVYQNETIKSGTGWTKRAKGEGEEIKANLNFSNFEQAQKDYGIADDIDMIVTTDEEVSETALIEYNNITYKILKLIVRDSHNYILCQNLRSEHKTSISL